MEGMMWGGLVLIGVPLAIGVGLALFLLRRRGGERGEDGRGGLETR